MPKIVTRIVALTLIPALLADSALAGVSSFMFQVSGSRQTWNAVFANQALGAAALNFRTTPLQKTRKAGLQHLEGQGALGMLPNSPLRDEFNKAYRRWQDAIRSQKTREVIEVEWQAVLKIVKETVPAKEMHLF